MVPYKDILYEIFKVNKEYRERIDGAKVSREQLQPNDLVFFLIEWTTYMGVFIGNRAYIHAPRTEDVAKISLVHTGDHLTARRLK